MLSADGEIEVVGAAADVVSARDQMGWLAPDVVVVDAALASRDRSGLLAKMMRQRPTPVVMVGADGGAEAGGTALGVAGDLAPTPSVARVAELGQAVVSRVKAAASGYLPAAPCFTGAPPPSEPRPHPVIAVGASLGGVAAIRRLLAAMPANAPGILIVQHMPPAFTRRFADRCNAISSIQVKEAEQGDLVRRGLALVAPGNYHMRLVRSAQGLCVALDRGPLVSGHRPSVDVLFDSVASALGSEAVGVLLTGMGRDGAQGLLRMKQAGGRTIAQDEASCVVFGMPQQALALGAVDWVLPLEDIAAQALLLAETQQGRSS